MDLFGHIAFFIASVPMESTVLVGLVYIIYKNGHIQKKTSLLPRNLWESWACLIYFSTYAHLLNIV